MYPLMNLFFCFFFMYTNYKYIYIYACIYIHIIIHTMYSIIQLVMQPQTYPKPKDVKVRQAVLCIAAYQTLQLQFARSSPNKIGAWPRPKCLIGLLLSMFRCLKSLKGFVVFQVFQAVNVYIYIDYIYVYIYIFILRYINLYKYNIHVPFSRPATPAARVWS